MNTIFFLTVMIKIKKSLTDTIREPFAILNVMKNYVLSLVRKSLLTLGKRIYFFVCITLSFLYFMFISRK